MTIRDWHARERWGSPKTIRILRRICPRPPASVRTRVKLRTLIAMALAVAASGCTRSVDWTEEVPLNTGETIWVQRHGIYSYGSNSGNPLEHGFHPDPGVSMEFEYRGKRYAHRIDTSLQILAIGPDGVPNLVTTATDMAWQWHNGRYCTRPSYVQFRPDASGTRWTALPQVEPWLFGLATNLMFGPPDLGRPSRRVNADDRNRIQARVYLAGDQYRRLDPSYQHPDCRRRS